MMNHQYITDILQNSRDQQQSSPSNNSISTGSPPHQISRASTALVVSSNNINSRQLTPNTSSSNNGGTNLSDNSNASSDPPSHHLAHQMAPHNVNARCPPNPMARQYVYHAKSMSAGVVVSVPGMPDDLATVAAINRNAGARINPHRNAANMDPANHNQQQHHHQQQHRHIPQHGRPDASNHLPPQQVVGDHMTRNPHHRQQSQPTFNHSSLHAQARPHQQHQAHAQYFDINPLHAPTNIHFADGRQATSSSIILSNHNINDIHQRSASAHLPNMLFISQNPHHHQPANLTNSRNYPSHGTTNSICSIDENISKSQGKLSGSCIDHHCLLESCDNVSNPARLMEPAPDYYAGPLKNPEFLPICDLLFNLISMITYFCEHTFGIIALIALYFHSAYRSWALVGGVFVLASNFICQYLSFKWIYKSNLEESKGKLEAQKELDKDARECRLGDAPNIPNHSCGSRAWLPHSTTELQIKFLLIIGLEAILHLFCLGFLARYIKLVIPINDTSRVKKEARDLCILRMVHGFVQSIPLVLLQAYIICSQTSTASITNLSIISVILSLVNVCWALASFTKYARKKYMHKFVLTWFGIVSQLLWRLGTVSSRVVALTIYGVYYGYWMLVILSLHWLTMFLWLIKPGNLLKDELNLPGSKKGLLAMATAWIYCFCYVNFEDQNSKLKMTSYYLIMFLENNLLLTVCLIFSSNVSWFKNMAIMVVYLGFVIGILFMSIYYKYLHVHLIIDELSIDSIANQLTPAGKKIAGFKPGTLRVRGEDTFSTGQRYNSNISASLQTGSHTDISQSVKPPYLSQLNGHNQEPFNCDTNISTKKQKSLKSHNRRQSKCS